MLFLFKICIWELERQYYNSITSLHLAKPEISTIYGPLCTTSRDGSLSTFCDGPQNKIIKTIGSLCCEDGSGEGGLAILVLVLYREYILKLCCLCTIWLGLACMYTPVVVNTEFGVISGIKLMLLMQMLYYYIIFLGSSNAVPLTSLICFVFI